MTSRHGGYRPNSGRPALPKVEVKKTRSIKFSDREWGLIREFAEKKGVSISEYVRQKALRN